MQGLGWWGSAFPLLGVFSNELRLLARLWLPGSCKAVHANVGPRSRGGPPRGGLAPCALYCGLCGLCW